MLKLIWHVWTCFQAWADDKPWLVALGLSMLLVIASVRAYATNSINVQYTNESLLSLFQK